MLKRRAIVSAMCHFRITAILPGCGSHDRKSNRKSRSKVFPRAFNSDFSMMKLNQVAHDCQSQSEPPLCSRSRAVGLTKTIEYIMQKLLANADAVIGDRNPHLGVRALY